MFLDSNDTSLFAQKKLLILFFFVSKIVPGYVTAGVSDCQLSEIFLENTQCFILFFQH